MAHECSHMYWSETRLWNKPTGILLPCTTPRWASTFTNKQEYKRIEKMTMDITSKMRQRQDSKSRKWGERFCDLRKPVLPLL